MGIALTTDPDKCQRQLAQFCDAVEQATRLRITRQRVHPYQRLLAEVEDGTLDLVWLPPLLALRSTGRGVVAPLALPVRHGVSTYSSALFCHPDSPIESVTTLHGANAAWVDAQSAAGYLVIRSLLRSRGVVLENAFDRNTFYGSHDAVVEAVLSGKADVGATFVYQAEDSTPDTVWPTPSRSTGRIPEKSAGWKERDVRVLLMAGSIPSDMLAARSQLEPEIRGALQDSLVTGEHPEVIHAANALLGAEGFIAPSREHLDGLMTMLSGLEHEPESVRSRAHPSRDRP